MFYEVQIVSGSVFIADLPAFLQSLNSFSEKNNIKIQGFDARKIIDQIIYFSQFIALVNLLKAGQMKRKISD